LYASRAATTPLHLAVESDNMGAVRLLVAFKADLAAHDGHGRSPMLRAVAQDGGLSVKVLLELKAAIGDDLLSTAVRHRSVSATRDLLAAKADPDAGHPCPVHAALLAQSTPEQTGPLAILQMLVHAKASLDRLDDNGHTALATAVANSHVYGVDFLLRSKACPTRGTELGNAPIHLAASRSTVGIISILVHHKAEVNAPDRGGSTALHRAQYRSGDNGDGGVVAILLAHRADVHATAGREKKTPLCLAVETCNSVAVMHLIAAGASVHDPVTSLGLTLLHCALLSSVIWYQSQAVVRQLLTAGADVHAAATHEFREVTERTCTVYPAGTTPLDLARARADPRILKDVEEAAIDASVVPVMVPVMVPVVVPATCEGPPPTKRNKLQP
jgi:ankyrin repeat protein